VYLLGALYFSSGSSSSISFKTISFDSCTSGKCGGALYLNIGGSANIKFSESSLFRNCKSNEDGGGLLNIIVINK
jgi:hypothetical protein